MVYFVDHSSVFWAFLTILGFPLRNVSSVLHILSVQQWNGCWRCCSASPCIWACLSKSWEYEHLRKLDQQWNGWWGGRLYTRPRAQGWEINDRKRITQHASIININPHFPSPSPAPGPWAASSCHPGNNNTERYQPGNNHTERYQPGLYTDERLTPRVIHRWEAHPGINHRERYTWV